MTDKEKRKYTDIEKASFLSPLAVFIAVICFILYFFSRIIWFGVVGGICMLYVAFRFMDFEAYDIE